MQTSLFPEYSGHQFNVLIVKQKISHAGLNEYIKKVLEINGYNIIKQASAVITESQAIIIGNIEELESEQSIELYSNTSVEVFVVSKEGAIKELKPLLQGMLKQSGKKKLSSIEDIISIDDWANDSFDHFSSVGKHKIFEKNARESLKPYLAENS